MCIRDRRPPKQASPDALPVWVWVSSQSEQAWHRQCDSRLERALCPRQPWSRALQQGLSNGLLCQLGC
eukprot:1022437-Alexandrium_andersonii.AAC.1